MYGSEFQHGENERLEVKGQIERAGSGDWVSSRIRSYSSIWIKEGTYITNKQIIYKHSDILTAFSKQFMWYLALLHNLYHFIFTDYVP